MPPTDLVSRRLAKWHHPRTHETISGRHETVMRLWLPLDGIIRMRGDTPASRLTAVTAAGWSRHRLRFTVDEVVHYDHVSRGIV
jgi:hypothetical protein